MRWLTLVPGKSILLNIVVMIMYMVVNSQFCHPGFGGGACVKEKDNFIFVIQLSVNFIFGFYYAIFVDKTIWFSLLLSIFILIGIYTILATIHSFLSE